MNAPAPGTPGQASRPAVSRTRLILLLAFGVLILGFAWFRGQSHGENTPGATGKADPTKTPVPVGETRVRTEAVPYTISAVGTTESLSSVSVKPQVDGIIRQIHFREGQIVRQGDPLFTLDERPLQAALMQSEANVAKDRSAVRQAQATQAKDQAQVRLAQANLQRDTAQLTFAQAQERRYTGLLQQEFISRESYEQISANLQTVQATLQADRAAIQNAQAQVQSDAAAVRSAQATLQADQALVEAARIQLGYTRIRAPFTGKAGSFQAHLGDAVSANTTPLVTINQISPVHVSFNIPENELATVQAARTRGTLTVEATPTQAGETAPTLKGRLAFVNNAVDPTTGTIQLKGLFDNADQRLWPGQYSTVVLTLGAPERAVVVPAPAVQTGQQGDYVFVDEGGKAVLRTVQVGRRVNDLAVIRSGLKPGERVVTDGQGLIAPGFRLKVKNL